MVPLTDPTAPLLSAWCLSMLGHQNADVLPFLAAVALAEGVDTPSVVDLAGRSRTEHPADLRELLGHVIDELGYSLNEGDAILWALYSRCFEVLSGERDAESASTFICRHLLPHADQIGTDHPGFPLNLLDDLSTLYWALDDGQRDLDEYRVMFDVAARRVAEVVPDLVPGPPLA